MKEYNGSIWSETNKDGTVSVGLTQNYIDNELMTCFHIMQADAQVLKKNGPMLVIETNDGLSSLKSPVTGRIMNFNDRARNFPDKLKESDTILTILPDGVKFVGKEKPKVEPARMIQDDIDELFANPQPLQWEANIAPPPPPQVQDNIGGFIRNWAVDNQQAPALNRQRDEMNRQIINNALNRVRRPR